MQTGVTALDVIGAGIESPAIETVTGNEQVGGVVRVVDWKIIRGRGATPIHRVRVIERGVDFRVALPAPVGCLGRIRGTAKTQPTVSTLKTGKKCPFFEKRPVFPQGKTIPPKGRLVSPDGKLVSPKGKMVSPKGKMVFPKGELLPPKGKVSSPKGRLVFPKGETIFLKGKKPSPEGKVFSPGGKVAGLLYPIG